MIHTVAYLSCLYVHTTKNETIHLPQRATASSYRTSELRRRLKVRLPADLVAAGLAPQALPGHAAWE